MKRLSFLLMIPLALLFGQCKEKSTQSESNSKTMFIQQSSIDGTIQKLTAKYGESSKTRMERGVRQIASLWTSEDGTAQDFENFCLKYYISDDANREKVFQRISGNFESLFGHANMVSLDFKRAMALDMGETFDIDEIFNAYDAYSHFNDDFSSNKISACFTTS